VRGWQVIHHHSSAETAKALARLGLPT
jgi:hypothetical protein